MASIPQFIEVRALERYSYGSRGGPRFKTRISGGGGDEDGSGAEFRSSIWGENSLSKWDLDMPITDLAEQEEVYAIVHILRGRTVPFRFKDRLDFEAVDVPIDTSGGGPTYQLRQAYVSAIFGPSYTVYKDVYKIVSGTVGLYLNTVPVVVTPASEAVGGSGNLWGQPLWGIPGDFTGVILDYNSGLLTFVNVAQPGPLDDLRWTGEFDKPARLAVDEPEWNFVDFNTFQIPSLPVVEVRPE